MAATPTKTEIALGDRSLLALKDLLDPGATVVATSENAIPLLTAEALALHGYGYFQSVPRDEAVATKHGMPSDGCTISVRDDANAKIIDKFTVKYRGCKQVGIGIVLQLPPSKENAIVVVAVGHFKSGTKSRKEEETRAAQMEELVMHCKHHQGTHNADAIIVIGDCNAALHPVTTSDGSVVPPLLYETLKTNGFKAVLPKEIDKLDPSEYPIWTSYKERDVSRRSGETGATAQRSKVIEKKKAFNDHIFLWRNTCSAKLKCFENRVEYLLPPEGGPNAATGMATGWSDHTSVFARFENGFSVIFLNMLARGLDDEMLRPIPPCLHPDFEEAAAEAVAAHPRATFKYDYGGTSKPNGIIEAPFTLHSSQASYINLAFEMEAAWERSIEYERTVLKQQNPMITEEDVWLSRHRAISVRTL